mgnify:CR=1 FL=1
MDGNADAWNDWKQKEMTQSDIEYIIDAHSNHPRKKSKAFRKWIEVHQHTFIHYGVLLQ